MTPAELLLGLVLTGTQSHYEHRSLIDNKRLEHLSAAGKQILYKSHQESDVRQALGFSPKVWQGLTDVLACATPVLEHQSFSYNNGSSSDLIALNYQSLVKDIERLNDLCTIARNLLATTKKAQNLAADKCFDQQILKLIDVCVKVTARGFDGDVNARNEERWQTVVNLYKRLLITCLQFLHNFIMHNEHRKLVLWLDLFGNSQSASNEIQQPDRLKAAEEEAVQLAREARIKTTVDNLPVSGTLTAEGGLGYNIDDVHALFDMMSATKDPDSTTREAAKILMDRIRYDMERLSGLNANQLDNDPEALLKVGAALRAQLPMKDFPPKTSEPNVAEQTLRKATVNINRTNAAGQNRAMSWTNLPDLSVYPDISGTSQEITDEDLAMPRTAQSAAETLQEAKDELMTRLQDAEPIDDENGDPTYDDEDGPDDGTLEDDIVGSVDGSLGDEEEEEEDDEDEDDYRRRGDQERGLLTDVPLVLGPTEIEALPMIIQAGIVDNFGMKNGDRQGAKNMQAVRCHILLAQESGRNVLRELLIFIAAWDLPDDEFYFKMMVQIMESILKNGLMSHAYADFGQAKDIISPAQAVVIKILTHIFRARYSPASVVQNSAEQAPPKPRVPAPLSRVDVLTVRYIFTVFRGNIIPETCALIYLQGQIRAGLALAEDFPLNLWDMERVYEGVYQFLEFFAVLTENNDWKRLLVDWEIVYDLVTLIKELDASIPKASLLQSMPPPKVPASSNDTQSKSSPAATPVPVAVERPYEVQLTDPAPLSTVDGLGVTSASTKTPSPVPATNAAPANGGQPTPEEPADFEWRNLKKLIVLVLSSLVWKSPIVQTQIREHGGVETILSCTQHDTNNPYIKEHAVMCLKFLLEGNKENQELVSNLEARQVVSDSNSGNRTGATASGGGATGMVEGLKEMGIEVGLDERGKVKVMRDKKNMMSAAGANTPAAMQNMRRASEGSRPGRRTSMTKLFEQMSRLDMNGAPIAGSGGKHEQHESGRVIGEELDDV